jgi:NACHT domain
MNSSASIIKSIKQNDSATCAFFFFDRRSAQVSLQSYDGLLRSIAYQLCAKLEAFPGILMSSYHNCGSGTIPPSRDALQQICTAALEHLQEAFIVVDALDECAGTEISQVVGWLEKLITGENPNLHVLVTSRDEAHITDPLSRVFKQLPVHVDELTQADIRLYIDLTMNNYGQLAQWGREIHAIIKQILIDGAGGM